MVQPPPYPSRTQRALARKVRGYLARPAASPTTGYPPTRGRRIQIEKSPEKRGNHTHQFTRFVSGISEAVKETAKARAGRKTYRENLLIEGATPGWVRVVLRVATPMIPKGQTVDEETAASTVDSDALRTVASILALASDPDLDTPLAAEIAELPIKARTALKRVAHASQQGGWAVRGMIRQRRVGAAGLELTNDGATRLRIELEVAGKTAQRDPHRHHRPFQVVARHALLQSGWCPSVHRRSHGEPRCAGCH